MPKILRNQIIIVLLICFSPLSYSDVVEGLFQSTVEVESQQRSYRQQAFNNALIKTLLKISGDRDLISDPNVQKRFFPAERFVQSFSYQESSEYLDYLSKQSAIQLPSSQLPSSQIETPVPNQYLLKVNFSTAALTKEMKALGFPVWGNVRPNIMFWGIIEERGERELLGSTINNNVMLAIADAAAEYALPLSFPKADITDKKLVNLSDLWGLFPEAIDEAKERYASDGDVMVRLHQSNYGVWSANWFFELNELAYSGSVKNVSLSNLSEELISFMSKILSQRFSIQLNAEPNQNKQVNLEVSNINTFQDYVDLQNFLSDLAPVRSLSISWLQGASVGLLVNLNGSASQFNEYISLSGKLKYLSTSSTEVLLRQPPEVDLNNTQTAAITSATGEPVNQQNLNSSSTKVKIVKQYKWLFSSENKKK